MLAPISEILQAALDYAERRWHVFPCDPANKRPLTPHGLNDATCDEETIWKWWEAWPCAMIGLRCGPEGDVWVIDLDVDEAKNIDGAAAFAALAAGKEPIGDTTRTRTPRGGEHIFFQWHDGIKNTASKIAPGVDTRGQGGFVILPPSARFDRKRYEFVADAYPPQAPQWLIDSVVKPEPVASTDLTLLAGAAADLRRGNGNGRGYGATALENECRYVASAPPGQRNATLNRAAFSLGQLVAGGVLDESEVRSRLFEAATQCGLVGEDGAEAVAATINSGLRAGVLQPRTPPERSEAARLTTTTAVVKPAGEPARSRVRRHRDGNSSEPRHLIKNVIPETGAGLLSGQFGTFKTFVAINLCMSTMIGHPFAGEYRVKRTGGVLYIATEGQSHLDRRIDAAAVDCGEDRPLPFYRLTEVPFLLDPKGLAQIIADTKEAAVRMQREYGVDLVLIVFDTMSGAAGYSKANDENDAAVTGRVMAAMREISDAIGAFVLGVDHFGKNVEVGTRGSSNKEAPAETVLALLADKSLAGEVQNTRLALRKVRDGATGREIPFTTKIVHQGIDEDGDPITTLVVDWKAPQPPATDQQWSKSLQLLRRILMTMLADAGTDVTPFADGPVVRAVDVELVRAEFAKQYLADGTPKQKTDARRMAFNRAVKDAHGKNLVASREVGGVQLIWLAKAETSK